jgi:hypothetical protein
LLKLTIPIEIQNSATKLAAIINILAEVATKALHLIMFSVRYLFYQIMSVGSLITS